MLTHSAKPTRRLKTGRPTRPRRLQIEPLELRTLLSAVPFALTGSDAPSLPEHWLPSPRDRQPSAEYGTAAAVGEPSTSSVGNADRLIFLDPSQEAAPDIMRLSSPPTLGAPASTGEPRKEFSAFSPGVLDTAPFSLLDYGSAPFGAGNGADATLVHSVMGGPDYLTPRDATRPWMLSVLETPSKNLRDPLPWHEANRPPDVIRALTDFYFRREDLPMPHGSLAGDGEFDRFRYEPVHLSTYESVADDGSVITLAAYSLLGLTDTPSTHSVYTETARQSQTAAAGLATDTTLGSGGSSRSQPAAGIATPAFDSWTEGGLIDVGQNSSTFSDRESGTLPTWLRSSLSRSIERDVVELLGERVRKLATDSGEDDRAEQGDRQPNKTSSGNRNAENSSPASAIALETCEGGMIELAAVSTTGGAGCQATRASDPVAKAGHDRAENIRIDRGLGLYRAFELASSLARPVEESNSAGDGRNAAATETESTLTATTADVPAAETSGATPAARSDQHHAAAAPVVLVMSLVFGMTGTPEERNRRTDDPQRNPQTPETLT